MKINKNYQELSRDYLFSEVARRVAIFQEGHPEARVIRLGIGDVTQPICPVVMDAMKQAAEDETHPETFHGYGPEQGYDFLREELRTVSIHSPAGEETVPGQMLDFLAGL